MLIGNIDFHQVILPSLAWTLSGGHKVGTKQNLLASFSPTPFVYQDKIWCCDEAIQAGQPETTFE